MDDQNPKNKALSKRPDNVSSQELIKKPPVILYKTMRSDYLVHKPTPADLHKAYLRRSSQKKNHKTDTCFRLFLKTNTLTFYPDLKKNHRFYFLAAIEEGHYETIERTLEKLNASKTTVYNDLYLKSQNSSIIEWAISHGQTDIAQLFLNYYEAHKNELQTDIDSYNEKRIFYCAIKNNNVNIAKRLLQNASIQVNEELDSVWFDFFHDFKPHNPYYHTPLSYAVFRGHHEMVEFLLESGATFKDRAYTSAQLKIIDDFSKRITILSDKRLECLRESLRPSLPSDPINLISAYAALPNYTVPAVKLKKV